MSHMPQRKETHTTPGQEGKGQDGQAQEHLHTKLLSEHRNFPMADLPDRPEHET